MTQNIYLKMDLKSDSYYMNILDFGDIYTRLSKAFLHDVSGYIVRGSTLRNPRIPSLYSITFELVNVSTSSVVARNTVAFKKEDSTEAVRKCQIEFIMLVISTLIQGK